MKDIYRLQVGIFVAGFCVMVLELLGTRILSPHLGSSLSVWTSLIGVVMAFLSLGYYWGGVLSEKNASLSILSSLLYGTALWVFLLIVTKESFMVFLLETGMPRYWQSIIAAIALLGPPSALLGAVSPYAARLSISSVRTSGSAVGNMYAISTVGSILGTFLTGFVFIPELGHLKTLYVVALLLTLASLALSTAQRWAKVVFICLCIYALYNGWNFSTISYRHVVEDIDTAYGRTQITETQTPVGVLSGMYTDGAYSSAVFPKNPRILVFPYYKYYDLMFWNEDVKNVLMLGGAGMGYPRYVTASYPNVSMTVVEIDPKLYEIAKRSMGYVPTDSVRMVFEDGRVFLNSNTKKYDAILIDVFSAHSIPWHLVTVESLKKVQQSLTDDGLAIVNIISSFEGNRSKIIQSIASTYKHVFESVELFSVQNGVRPSDAQNIILVATNKKLDFSRNNLSARSKALLSQRKTVEMSGTVLTDDWSPIDTYTEAILNK